MAYKYVRIAGNRRQVGQAIAELRPLARHPVPAAVLLKRWRQLPVVDPAELRADIDDVLDGSL